MKDLSLQSSTHKLQSVSSEAKARQVLANDKISIGQ